MLMRTEKPIFLAFLVPSWKIVEHFVGQLVDLVDDLNARNSLLILLMIYHKKQLVDLVHDLNT